MTKEEFFKELETFDGVLRLIAFCTGCGNGPSAGRHCTLGGFYNILKSVGIDPHTTVVPVESVEGMENLQWAVVDRGVSGISLDPQNAPRDGTEGGPGVSPRSQPYIDLAANARQRAGLLYDAGDAAKRCQAISTNRPLKERLLQRLARARRSAFRPHEI